VVLRVRGHREARPRALEEVRDEVTARLVQEKAAAAAQARAAELVELARAGKAPEQVAKEAGAAYERVAGLARRAPGVPAALVDAAFTLPRPAAGQPAVAAVPLGDGDMAVAALYGVKDGSGAVSDPQAAGLRAALGMQQGSVERARYQEDRRARAELELKPLAAEAGRPLD